MAVADDCKTDISNFDTLVTTGMALKHHRVKWVLNNFSKLPMGTEFASSPIKPLPLYEWKMIFKKEKNSCLYLVSMSDIKIELNFELSIVDLNRKRWYHDSQVNVTFSKDYKRDILRCTENIMKELSSLKDDVLIFMCDFEICLNISTETRKMQQKEDALTVQGQEKLLSDLKAMYKNHQHTDLTLVSGEGQLRVHRSLMCARSPVFEKMFDHQTEENKCSTVHIKDVKLPELRKLVDFMYTGVYDAEEDIELIYALYYISDKYEVLDLRKMCSETLLNKMEVANATRILTWANRHEDEHLKSEVSDFILGHFDVIADTDAWDEFVSSDTKLAAELIKYYTKRFALKQS